jgi:hypothetical protein
MFTSRPDIAYALPPKRSGKKQARVEHPKLPTTVHALPPKEIERKRRAAALEAKMARVVDTRKPSPLDGIDPVKAGAAADRLWQELVRAENSASDQPAPGRGKNKRGKSGQ